VSLVTPRTRAQQPSRQRASGRPRARAERGNVAENMTVWRSGRVSEMMRAICGSKPMSNMRSASSITRYVTRRQFVILPLLVAMTSIRRPGVHTTTCNGAGLYRQQVRGSVDARQRTARRVSVTQMELLRRGGSDMNNTHICAKPMLNRCHQQLS
jgi:hypothetical protein